jgi:L-histidine N-alpha-methyltransferase
MPGDPRPLVLHRGDEIRTEISRKFTAASFAAALEGPGLELDGFWSDDDGLFALALARPAAAEHRS